LQEWADQPDTFFGWVVCSGLGWVPG
jgi:hypothetical protein